MSGRKGSTAGLSHTRITFIVASTIYLVYVKHGADQPDIVNRRRLRLLWGGQKIGTIEGSAFSQVGTCPFASATTAISQTGYIFSRHLPVRKQQHLDQHHQRHQTSANHAVAPASSLGLQRRKDRRMQVARSGGRGQRGDDFTHNQPRRDIPRCREVLNQHVQPSGLRRQGRHARMFAQTQQRRQGAHLTACHQRERGVRQQPREAGPSIIFQRRGWRPFAGPGERLWYWAYGSVLAPGRPPPWKARRLLTLSTPFGR